MKTAIYFIISCLISTGALLGGLHANNPFPNFIVAFGIWGLLFGVTTDGLKSWPIGRHRNGFRRI